jgi:FtsZ-binding cell division protein ZapB
MEQEGMNVEGMKDTVMSIDDLLKKVADLEESLKNEKKSSEHWYREHNKVKEDFRKYRNAIQSVVELLD